MKILYKTMRLWLLAVCLCTLAATPASAKVCFVGEENCTGGGSFDDYKDPGEDGNLCKKEGFGTTAAECRNDPNKDITAYCPYNNNYVKCCGKEYVYDAPCVYPLVTKGKCGNKYKCECDSSQYKYTDHECKTIKGAAGEGYENSYGSGSFCTQQSYDSNTQKIVSEVRYSSCQCDRGIYPKFGSSVPNDPNRKSDCDFNAEKQGPCSTKYATGNRSETYYKFCRCNTRDFPKTDSGCYPLTGDANRATCFDTIMHYESCASCGKYPARNLDHVPYSPGSKAVQCEKDDKGNLVDPDCDYEVCPYDQTGNTYFKIRKCNEPGYEPNSNHSACVPISCSKAVNQFLAEDGNKEYARFDGKYLRDASGNVAENAKIGIVAGNVTLASSSTCSTSIVTYKNVCTAGFCTLTSNSSCLYYDEGGRVCTIGGVGSIGPGDVVRPPEGIGGGGSLGGGSIVKPDKPTIFCCTSVKQVSTGTKYPSQGELGCSSATRYYSPAYVVYEEDETSSDGAKAMSVACTGAVSINANRNLTGKKNSITTYGVDWRLSGNVDKPMGIYNGKVSFSYAKIKANMLLTRQDGKPNAGNSKATGYLSIYSAFKSTGYDYDMEKIHIDNQGWGNNIWFAGTDSKKSTIKAKNLTIWGIAGFKNVVGDVKRTYVGCSEDGPGYPYSTVTLYNTDWYMYDKNQTSKPKYYLYLNAATVFGYGADGTSQILFATSARSKTCVNKTREKHGENGKHSCNNHVAGPAGNHSFYYIDSSGTRQTVYVPSSWGDWCTSGGDYDNPNEWIDWGYWDGDKNFSMTNGNWDSMYPECW